MNFTFTLFKAELQIPLSMGGICNAAHEAGCNIEQE
jgi:hypothetical protein